MIGTIKTVRTVTFVCCECRIPLKIKTDTILAAEDVARQMGWTERPSGQALCADCGQRVR
jgi:hypothetical protein